MIILCGCHIRLTVLCFLVQSCSFGVLLHLLIVHRCECECKLLFVWTVCALQLIGAEGWGVPHLPRQSQSKHQLVQKNGKCIAITVLLQEKLERKIAQHVVYRRVCKRAAKRWPVVLHVQSLCLNLNWERQATNICVYLTVLVLHLCDS